MLFKQSKPNTYKIYEYLAVDLIFYTCDCFIGNILGPSPVSTIVHCLARKEGTDQFYNLKVVD